MLSPCVFWLSGCLLLCSKIRLNFNWILQWPHTFLICLSRTRLLCVYMTRSIVDTDPFLGGGGLDFILAAPVPVESFPVRQWAWSPVPFFIVTNPCRVCPCGVTGNPTKVQLSDSRVAPNYMAFPGCLTACFVSHRIASPLWLATELEVAQCWVTREGVCSCSLISDVWPESTQLCHYDVTTTQGSGKKRGVRQEGGIHTHSTKWCHWKSFRVNCRPEAVV